MSSEVPLDLSNDSKPKSNNKSNNKTQKKKTLNSNISIINGTKNNGKNSRTKQKSEIQMKSVSDDFKESVHKKQKLGNTGSGGDVNPLQRGKYGLRMMPTQVDYYQSILEDRRIRMYRESSRQIPEIEILEKDLKPEKPKQTIRKTKSNQSNGKYEFEIGDIVWGTLPNYKTWFPALIISHMHCKQKPAKKGQTWVYWFGDHQVSEIPKSKIKSFVQNFSEFSKGTSSLTSLRVKEALQVLASRAAISFPLDENVASSSSSSTYGDENAMTLWAKNGFKLKTEMNVEKAFKADPLNPIPSLAACYLPLDAVYQEALKTDERLQQIVYYEVDKTENAEGVNELPEYKLSQIERVKSKEVTINQICIACYSDAESLVGNNCKLLLEHPIFEGGLCRLCYDNIKVTMYAPGADQKNSFCAICGQLGKLAICENDNCHRVYCLKCIDLLVGSGVHLKVLEMEKWECYICKPTVEKTGLLKVRPNWRFNVKMLFDPIVNGLKSAHLLEESPNGKIKLRVLSLVDGIATAKIALEKLGFMVDMYYASEADSDAINIAKNHHKEDIHYIDSIENITIEKLVSMGPIDLILGSSPTESSFSSSGRKSLLDSKGSGHHFLYFNHILHLVRLTNKSHHVFFLFENSNPLNNSQRDTISDLLMCKPVTLYGNDFCQNRNRYYWSNIPGIKRPLPQNIQEKFISLINILTQNMARKGINDKLQTVQKMSILKQTLEQDSEDKSFEPNELEKLFGLPENYTNVNSLTKNKRQLVLTKSWCVSILSHLIWSLSDFFMTNTEHI